MHIALLGGSFNPPHNGHLVMARASLAQTGANEVWLLPNFRQSPPKDVASVSDRLAMVRLLEEPKILVSTIETDHKLSGETVEILPWLPGLNTYAFIMGSDQLTTFFRWQDYGLLLSKLQFWVYPRVGYPLKPMYNGMRILHGSPYDVSSTDVRKRAAVGESLAELVPEKVVGYIAKHGLYTAVNT